MIHCRNPAALSMLVGWCMLPLTLARRSGEQWSKGTSNVDGGPIRHVPSWDLVVDPLIYKDFFVSYILNHFDWCRISWNHQSWVASVGSTKVVTLCPTFRNELHPLLMVISLRCGGLELTNGLVWCFVLVVYYLYKLQIRSIAPYLQTWDFHVCSEDSPNYKWIRCIISEVSQIDQSQQQLVEFYQLTLLPIADLSRPSHGWMVVYLTPPFCEIFRYLSKWTWSRILGQSLLKVRPWQVCFRAFKAVNLERLE